MDDLIKKCYEHFSTTFFNHLQTVNQLLDIRNLAILLLKLFVIQMAQRRKRQIKRKGNILHEENPVVPGNICMQLSIFENNHSNEKNKTIPDRFSKC